MIADAPLPSAASRFAPQASALLAAQAHPLAAEIDALRQLILGADASLVEGVKWNAPSYADADGDRITFNLRARDRILLIFHRGAKPRPLAAPGRLLDDAGLLAWKADDRAVATLRAGDAARRGRELATLVVRWLQAARGA